MRIRIDGTPEEIEQATVSDQSDRRGRQLLPPATASALAAALLPSDGPAPEDPEAARGLLEAQVEPYRDQIAALEREVERLTDQIANRDADAVEAMAQAEQRIEDLKRENAQLREDLALSRRLEGFHWPWTRDRFKKLSRERGSLSEGGQGASHLDAGA